MLVRDQLLVLGLLAAGRLAGQEPPLPLATIPFEIVSVSTPVVRLRVNGSEPLTLVLDTGASSCILDERLVGPLGLRVGPERRGTGAGAGTYRVDSIATKVTFGKHALSFACDPVYSTDLSGQLSILGRRIDGIIGHGFFTQYVAEIDYDLRLLRLFEPRTFTYQGTGDSIHLELRRHRPLIQATLTVPGSPPTLRSLLIDTGSEDAVDDSLLLKSTGPKRRITGGVGLGQEYEVFFGTLDHVRIGKTDLRDVPSAAPGVALIGGAVLSRFRLTLDYGREEAFFEPNPVFFGGFAPAAPSGIELRADPSGALRVHAVPAATAAETAGLRPGDLIVTIDGTPTSELQLSQTERWLGRKGVAARLTAQRQGKTVSLVFRNP